MFANLAVAGGAHFCIPFVGFLNSAAPALTGVRWVSGCSGGALVAAAWVLDVPPQTVMSILSDMMGEGILGGASLPLLWDRFGMVDVELEVGASARRMVTAGVTRWKLMRNGDPPGDADAGDTTMLELAKLTGRSLAIGVCDVGRGFSDAFITAETHPDVPVWKALAASCAIPFAFTPVTIGTEMYCDGCFDPVAGIPGRAPPEGVVDTLLLQVGKVSNRKERESSIPATIGEFGKGFLGKMFDRACSCPASARTATVDVAPWTGDVALPMISGISGDRLWEAYRHGARRGKEFLEDVNKGA